MTEPENFDMLYKDRPVLRPTAGAYIRHLLLLALTFCTVTLAGTMFPFGRFDTFPESDPQTFAQFLDFVFSMPVRYITLIGSAVTNVITNPAELAYGLSFSVSLLFILICHEMGHYIACRIYRVDATLPFFIPTPPMVGPAGTFGAFIKILSPMPSRRAVFDIGVAGPIAGFLALVPVAVLAFATMKVGTLEDLRLGNVSPISFSDPLLIKGLALVFKIDLNLPIYANPYYYAAWVGLLVTALNLIPSGQLDGGHAIYAVLGEKVHYWTGRVAFFVMATLSIVGFYFFNSPSGFLIAVILAVMMRIRHPQPWDQTPLDAKRKVIALLTLIIFILCFVPFPIQIN